MAASSAARSANTAPMHTAASVGGDVGDARRTAMARTPAMMAAMSACTTDGDGAHGGDDGGDAGTHDAPGAAHGGDRRWCTVGARRRRRLSRRASGAGSFTGVAAVAGAASQRAIGGRRIVRYRCRRGRWRQCRRRLVSSRSPASSQSPRASAIAGAINREGGARCRRQLLIRDSARRYALPACRTRLEA